MVEHRLCINTCINLGPFDYFVSSGIPLECPWPFVTDSHLSPSPRPNSLGPGREARRPHPARRPVPPQLQRERRRRPGVHLVQGREVPHQRHRRQQVRQALRQGRRRRHRRRPRRPGGRRVGQRKILLQGTCDNAKSSDLQVQCMYGCPLFQKVL